MCEYRCKKKVDEVQEVNQAEEASQLSDSDKKKLPGKSKFQQCLEGHKQRAKDRVDKIIQKSPVVNALKKSALQTEKKRKVEETRQRNLEKKRSKAALKCLKK